MQWYKIQKLNIMDFSSLWHGQVVLSNNSIKYGLKWKLSEIINATWYAYFTITMQCSLGEILWCILGEFIKKIIHSGKKQPVKGGDIFSVLRLVKNGGRVAKEK